MIILCHFGKVPRPHAGCGTRGRSRLRHLAVSSHTSSFSPLVAAAAAGGRAVPPTILLRPPSRGEEVTLRHTTSLELQTNLYEVWSCIIMEKAPTTVLRPSPRWKQLLLLSHFRYYAKWALTHGIKLGHWHKSHNGQAALRIFSNQLSCPLWTLNLRPYYTSTYHGLLCDVIIQLKTLWMFVWSSNTNPHYNIKRYRENKGKQIRKPEFASLVYKFRIADVSKQ